MDQITTITECIRSHMKDKSITFRDIEEKSNLSYSMIYRILNDQREITPLEIVEILNSVFSEKEALEVVLKYFPENKQLKSLYSDIHSETTLTQYQEKLFTDLKSFDLVNLIELGYITTKEQVKELYGSFGTSILEEMNSKGLIEISSLGEIKRSYSVKFLKPTFETIKKQISNSVSFHKDSNCGKLKNFLYFGTKLLNKKEREKIQIITRSFRDILNSLLHKRSIEKSLVDKLSKEILSFNDIDEKSMKRTEPIFYSILFDDFLNEDQNKRSLQ